MINLHRIAMISAANQDSMSVPPTFRDGMYQVYTPAQMSWCITDTSVSSGSRMVKLMCDIVYNEDHDDYLSWVLSPPPNVSAHGAAPSRVGKLNGNGKTIYGFYTNRGTFIRDLGGAGEVYDLRFKHCFFINTPGATDHSCGPIRCGCAKVCNVCSEACYIRGQYSSSQWYGAFGILDNTRTGLASGEVSKTKNNYSIGCTFAGVQAYGHAGAMYGQNDGVSGEFYNSYASAASTVFNYLAGATNSDVFNRVYKASSIAYRGDSGAYSTINCADKTDAEMQTQAFCDLLNEGSAADSDGLCSDWHWQNEMFPYLFNWTQT